MEAHDIIAASVFSPLDFGRTRHAEISVIIISASAMYPIIKRLLEIIKLPRLYSFYQACISSRVITLFALFSAASTCLFFVYRSYLF